MDADEVNRRMIRLGSVLTAGTARSRSFSKPLMKKASTLLPMSTGTSLFISKLKLHTSRTDTRPKEGRRPCARQGVPGWWWNNGPPINRKRPANAYPFVIPPKKVGCRLISSPSKSGFGLTRNSLFADSILWSSARLPPKKPSSTAFPMPRLETSPERLAYLQEQCFFVERSLQASCKPEDCCCLRLKGSLPRRLERIFSVGTAGRAVDVDAFQVGEFSRQLVRCAPGDQESRRPAYSKRPQ